MGAVSIDIHKKEREFEHLTLSDKYTVKYLILYRNKVDISYGANVNIDISVAGDMFEFNQELICLYASLDEIIKKIKWNEKEQNILELVFAGNTISDIIKYYEFPKKTAYRIVSRIAEKIVDENNNNWREVMKSKILY